MKDRLSLKMYAKFKSISSKMSKFCYLEMSYVHVIPRHFGIFLIFKFCPIWAIKSVPGSCFAFSNKNWPELYHTA